MSVYKDLEKITDAAVHLSKEHKCNYNIILMNPDENGEFGYGSTYEMVADSYFEKERPNVLLLHKTDDLIAQEQEDTEAVNDMIINNQFLNPNNVFKIKNTYKDYAMYDHGSYSPGIPYVREERKIGNNEPCKCGSGKKYKKCCK